jgi:hypothetical protein
VTAEDVRQAWEAAGLDRERGRHIAAVRSDLAATTTRSGGAVAGVGAL